MDLGKQTPNIQSHRKLSKFMGSIFVKDKQNKRESSDCSVSSIFNDEMRKKMQKSNISDQFVGFFKFVSDSMIVSEKRYTQIQRGLYLLLKGKICFTWTSKKHDVEKKQYLFNLAKTGVFFFYNDPCLKDQQLQQSQSFPIEQPFTIFECQSDSCYVLEDSILLKVENQMRQMTNFDDLFQSRQRIVENCHIGGQINMKNNLFTVNLKLHSTFKKYQYRFHSKIEFQTLAIVESGILKPVKEDIMKITKSYFQMQKYSVLLPGVSYEVFSTQARILVIENNPTLSYIHPDLVNAHKYLKMRSQKMYKKSNINRGNRTVCNSVHCSRTPQQITRNMKKRQINNRRKNLTSISKKFQNQLIISMQTCKQSLSFSEQQTEEMKNSIQKQKYKRPNILFDYSKYCSNKSLKNFHNAFLESRGSEVPKVQVQSRMKKERKTFNDNLMTRYKYFSREMYNKFSQQSKELQFCPQQRQKWHFDSSQI